jgi:hypothetical protein
MKSFTTFIIATALAAACSPSGPQQAADSAQDTAPAAPERGDAQPALPSGAAPAAPPPSSAAAAPPATQTPTFHDVTIPAGTSLSVTVLSAIASNTSTVEDPVRGALAKPVAVSGSTAVPAGAQISGSIIDVKESGRVKGRALLAFRFDRIVVRGETHQIQTARVIREAESSTRDDVKKGGIGAGVGAVVGGIAGGGKGAAIGGVAGGTGAVLATRGDEVEIAPGTVVDVLLQEPLTVRVPIE